MMGLGAEKRRDSRSEKGESSRGSVDPSVSGEVSKIFKSSKPQEEGGEEGGQFANKPDRGARGF